MPRVFIPTHQIHGSVITIDDARQIHHLRDVLRLKMGDGIICCDSPGTEHRGLIRFESKDRLEVELQGSSLVAKQSVSIWLAAALIKANRFDWLVQKATELGVSRISPLVTRYTVIRLRQEQARSKCARWQRIAQEAAKQCGRKTLPIVDVPEPMGRLLEQTKQSPLVLIPTLVKEAIPLSEVLKSSGAAREVVVFIGPEGDFSEEELRLARSFGARPVSLGSLTLRSETAAVAAVAILQYSLGGL